MEDPAHLNAGQNQELRIFFPPNDDLTPPNTLLHRSAVVLVGPGVHFRQMPHRIANALAASLGRHPAEFTVSQIEPAYGDFLVTFTSNIMRNIAVYQGVFMIAQGVEVQLRAWTPNLSMVRDPTTHMVRLRLRGVPLTYWNLPHVNHLISGFGYVVRLAPVITNGNFDSLRVLVACYNPVHVPPALWLTKDPFSRIVHVEIEGWINNNDVPHYPPEAFNPDGHDTTDSDDSDDSDGAHSNVTAAANNRRQGQNLRNPQSEGNNTQGESTRIARQGIRNGDGRRRASSAGPKLQSTSKLEAPVFSSTGGHAKENDFLAGSDVSQKVNEKVSSVVSNIEVTPLTLTSGLQVEGQHSIISLISGLSPAERQKEPATNPSIESQVSPKEQVIPNNYWAETEPTQVVGRTVQELNPTQHSNAGAFIGKDITGGKEALGAPPGFEGPPRYKHANRSSARLRAKNSGRYISVVDRARANSGFISIPALMQKIKAKKVGRSVKTVPGYLKGSDPLTGEHVEVLLAAAGVEEDDNLKRQIEVAMAELEEGKVVDGAEPLEGGDPLEGGR